MTELTQLVCRYKAGRTEYELVEHHIILWIFKLPCLKRRLTEDERSEFLLYMYPRIPRIVHSFRYIGVPFEAYLRKTVYYRVTSFRRAYRNTLLTRTVGRRILARQQPTLAPPEPDGHNDHAGPSEAPRLRKTRVTPECDTAGDGAGISDDEVLMAAEDSGRSELRARGGRGRLPDRARIAYHDMRRPPGGGRPTTAPDAPNRPRPLSETVSLPPELDFRRLGGVGQRVARRRLLTTVLKCICQLPESQVAQLAELCGVDESWLLRCREHFLRKLSPRIGRRVVLRRRRLHAYFRLQTLETRLADSENDEIRETLKRRVRIARTRYLNASLLAIRDPLRPSNEEIATLVGVSPGTMHSEMSVIRRAVRHYNRRRRMEDRDDTGDS